MLVSRVLVSPLSAEALWATALSVSSSAMSSRARRTSSCMRHRRWFRSSSKWVRMRSSVARENVFRPLSLSLWFRSWPASTPRAASSSRTEVTPAILSFCTAPLASEFVHSGRTSWSFSLSSRPSVDSVSSGSAVAAGARSSWMYFWRRACSCMAFAFRALSSGGPGALALPVARGRPSGRAILFAMRSPPKLLVPAGLKFEMTTPLVWTLRTRTSPRWSPSQKTLPCHHGACHCSFPSSIWSPIMHCSKRTCPSSVALMSYIPISLYCQVPTRLRKATSSPTNPEALPRLATEPLVRWLVAGTSPGAHVVLSASRRSASRPSIVATAARSGGRNGRPSCGTSCFPFGDDAAASDDASVPFSSRASLLLSFMRSPRRTPLSRSPSNSSVRSSFEDAERRSPTFVMAISPSAFKTLSTSCTSSSARKSPRPTPPSAFAFSSSIAWTSFAIMMTSSLALSFTACSMDAASAVRSCALAYFTQASSASCFAWASSTSCGRSALPTCLCKIARTCFDIMMTSWLAPTCSARAMDAASAPLSCACACLAQSSSAAFRSFCVSTSSAPPVSAAGLSAASASPGAGTAPSPAAPSPPVPRICAGTAPQ
mmetsp:Transcript_3324/g.9426  ORF Transcript_3324/g.9426 Transcript_3324/m.9426 type:complete len:601 (+) Transcript_3324:570-2372(+)